MTTRTTAQHMLGRLHLEDARKAIVRDRGHRASAVHVTLDDVTS